jgi:Tol biopolymer transport system component
VIRRFELLALFSGVLLVSISLGAEVMAQTIAPNGRIVFESDADGDWDVWTMNGDGSDSVNLTSGGEPPEGWQDDQPSWSPDGTRIAFTSTRGGGEDRDIFVMGADGSGIAPVTANQDWEDLGPDWSPDGSHLVFTRRPVDGLSDSDIFVVDADGSNERNISESFEAQPGQHQWSDNAPDWSPVANSIVFASARQVEGSPEGAYWRIVKMNPDGSNQTVVSDPNDPGNDPFPDESPNFDQFPEWSPDGRWIAFATDQQPEQQWDIQIVRANGTDQQNVLPDQFIDDMGPTWSPSGTDILFTSNRAEDRTLAVYSLDVSGFIGSTSSTVSSRVELAATSVVKIGGVGNAVNPDQYGRLPCTIRGSAAGDRLQGTSSRDVICAGLGADTIEAAGGRDVVYAGGGTDVAFGRGGGDILFGDGGSDRLNGGAGVDLCPDVASTNRTGCEG